MKKAAVKFLTSRELRYFENTYQGLKNFPGWHMPNIFNEKTRECYGLSEQCAREFFKDFKKHQTRLDVACHESGHAIVMQAGHGSVGKVRIDAANEGFSGCVTAINFNPLKSDSEPLELAPMPMMAVIRHRLLADSAGFIGESFVGSAVGSCHEKFVVYCQTRYLDELDGMRPLTNWAHYTGWCKRIIKNNENLFWAVVDDLLAHSELSDTVKARLYTRTKKEPLELFFN